MDKKLLSQNESSETTSAGTSSTRYSVRSAASPSPIEMGSETGMPTNGEPIRVYTIRDPTLNEETGIRSIPVLVSIPASDCACPQDIQGDNDFDRMDQDRASTSDTLLIGKFPDKSPSTETPAQSPVLPVDQSSRTASSASSTPPIHLDQGEEDAPVQGGASGSCALPLSDAESTTSQQVDDRRWLKITMPDASVLWAKIHASTPGSTILVIIADYDWLDGIAAPSLLLGEQRWPLDRTVYEIGLWDELSPVSTAPLSANESQPFVGVRFVGVRTS